MKKEEEIAIMAKDSIEKYFDFEMKEVKEFPELAYDAFNVSGFFHLPKEIVKIKKDKDKNTIELIHLAFIYVQVNTNPAGVSGEDDIERTLTISVTVKGTQKDYRKHNEYEKEFYKSHEYIRVGDTRDIATAIEELVINTKEDFKLGMKKIKNNAFVKQKNTMKR